MVSRRTASAAALSSVKVRELTDESETLIDLLSRERLHPFRTEALHRKGAHYATVKHGVRECLQCDLGLGGEVSEEAAGKRIAGTGGIHHLVQRQSGRAKRHGYFARRRSVERLLTKERGRTVFAVLDDEGLWTHRQNLARGHDQVTVIGEQLGFSIVDQQRIEAGENLRQVLAMPGD